MAEEEVERGGAPRGAPGAAREIKVHLSNDIAKGVYANGVMITHSRDEFVVDFGMVVGSAGTIVSRVIMGPAQAKRLAVALADHLARFEKAHGNLDPAVGPAIRIGFQPSEAE